MAIKRKPHLTQQAHSLIQAHFSDLKLIPQTAIDASCGNGFDTLFLAEYASEKTYAFDIQAIAIQNTRNKLQTANLLAKVELIQAGHENMLEHVNHTIDIIMFNFGYLPQADKSITTMTDTSMSAIQSAIELLSEYGILSVLCYPGHTEGKKETLAIKHFFETLSHKLVVKEFLSNHPNDKSPVLFLVNKT